MNIINRSDRFNLITEFRNNIQSIFSDQLRVKMQVSSFSEEHLGGSSLSVFLTSEAASAEKQKTLTEEALLSTKARRKLLGKPRDFQRFLDKEGPSYDKEFMLDIEFDYNTGTCTIHHINLPLHMRDRGFGGCIVQKAELLAKKMGMTDVYVPAEHRATAFWLKRGYRFTFPAEKIFYESNSGRSNIYIAYDLRKNIESGDGSLTRRQTK
ncbi:MAG: hypothetical protein ACOY4I_00120 [Bacillota bacterium]